MEKYNGLYLFLIVNALWTLIKYLQDKFWIPITLYKEENAALSLIL